MKSRTKQEMIDLYKVYGYDFPPKAKYKRQPTTRIYFSNDFQDNEEIEFFWNCDKPSACAIGNAYYMNNKGQSNLINIRELEEIKGD